VRLANTFKAPSAPLYSEEAPMLSNSPTRLIASATSLNSLYSIPIFLASPAFLNTNFQTEGLSEVIAVRMGRIENAAFSPCLGLIEAANNIPED